MRRTILLELVIRIVLGSRLPEARLVPWLAVEKSTAQLAYDMICRVVWLGDNTYVVQLQFRGSFSWAGRVCDFLPKTVNDFILVPKLKSLEMSLTLENLKCTGKCSIFIPIINSIMKLISKNFRSLVSSSMKFFESWKY